MDENFKLFYKSLDPTKFKYFVKDNDYYVYESDLDFIPANLKPKSERFAKVSNIEQIIKELLINKKIAVEEYTFVGPDSNQRHSISDANSLEATYKGRNFDFSSGYDDSFIFSSEYSQNSFYKLTRRGFPHDYLDFLDICLGESIPPTIFAVVVTEVNKVSVAFIKDSKIMECEFLDDDLFSNLYSLSSSYNCVEFLYCNKIMEKVFNTWGVSCLLVKFANCSDMIKTYMKIDLPCSKFLKEDCCFLNISDFDLVDFGCITIQGKRLLNQWLRSPSTNIIEINQRLDLSEVFNCIKINLNRISDLKRVSTRIYNRNITINEVIKLCTTIDLIPGILESLKGFEKQNTQLNDGSFERKCQLINSCFISPLQNLIFIFNPLLSEIKTKINFKTSRIHSHLSDELRALESEKYEIYREIENEFVKVKKDFPKLSFSNRMFKISRLEYNQNNFDSQKYNVISLLKNGAHFLTKNLSELNEKLEKLEKEIIIAESTIFNQIKNTLIQYITSIDSFNFLIALMDIYNAFSTKVTAGNYSRPVFSDSDYKIKGMFHPLLEHKGVILNDIAFDKDVCILTGPNMGGKSTFLKTLSMISLYAQIGCYVPAQKAILPVFDKIFLRIGARDCTSQRMSTFMVEMTDLNKILRTGTPRSLVLIDELGRGTSAIDGISLVLAVKEHLINLKAKTVMATHFSQVGDNRTLNKKMCVMDNVLTYRIEDGTSDSSFGLKVAEIAGFPKDVLAKASEYLKLRSKTNQSFL